MVVFISAASEINAQTFKVESTVKANAANVQVKKGDIIEITDIVGKFYYNAEHGGSGYDGTNPTSKSDSSFEFPDADPHSLVMWVGDKKTHF